MRAAIGSQCKLINRGVTCVLFSSLKIFWINYKGLIELSGREHCNSQVWTEQELEQWVCEACSERKGLIFLMLNKANLQDRTVLVIWSEKFSWSSIITPRFLVARDLSALTLLHENKPWSELNSNTMVICFITESNLFIIDEFCNSNTVIEQNWINSELTWSE